MRSYYYSRRGQNLAAYSMPELRNTFKKGDIMNFDRITDILTALAALAAAACVWITFIVIGG